MNKFKLKQTTIFLIILFLIFGAQTVTGKKALGGADNIDALLKNFQKARTVEAKINKERERYFLNKKNERARLLKEIQEEIQRKDKATTALLRQIKQTDKQLDVLRDELNNRAGNLNEMFGAVRQFSGDLKAVLEESLVSAQYPGRHHFLDQLSQSSELPPIEKLERLWTTFLQEMAETGRVVSFPSEVVTAKGAREDRQVIRVGQFAALSEGRFLRYSPATNKLMELSRQPSSHFIKLAKKFENSPEGVMPMVIDPTRGAILNLLVQKPNLRERIKQGGLVGYIIITIGAAGLILAFFRFHSLYRTGGKITEQLSHTETPQPDNPLGRILRAAKEYRQVKAETLEQCLEEAILKEIPPLERGQAIIKLLSVVAPLLGLLGTVIGMIITFQTITLFGTGDPKLMADGISQALITTALGLITAIPLLFSHSLILARSKAIIQILEQQSAGIIAMNIERQKDIKDA